MKNKLFFVAVLLLLSTVLTVSLVSATGYEYTGESTEFVQGIIVWSGYTQDADNYHYWQRSALDYAYTNGIWQFANTTNMTKYCYQPFKSGFVTYHPDMDLILASTYQVQGIYSYEAGEDFCTGSGDWGEVRSQGIETECKFPANGNVYEMNYDSGLLYVFSKTFTTKHLCVLDNNGTHFSLVSTHNISNELLGSSLPYVRDDKLFVVGGGVVYAYEIDDNLIDTTDYIDSWYPTTIQGDRGTYINDSGLYLWKRDDGIIYKHEDVDLSEPNFPYVLANGDYYSTTQQCVHDEFHDIYYLCNDTIINVYQNIYGEDVVQTSCNSYEARSNCVSACSQVEGYDDDFDIDFIYGECDITDCKNECNNFNQRVCTTSKSYQVCAQFDSDICWEWGSIHECSDGQFCAYSNEIAYCEDIDFDRDDNEIIVPEFDIKPYALDGNEGLLADDWTDYEFDIDSLNRLNVETTMSTHVQSFGYVPRTESTEQFYIGKTCEYTEKEIYNENFEDFVSTDWTLTGDWNISDSFGNNVLSSSAVGAQARLYFTTQRANNEFELDIDFEGTGNNKLYIVHYNEMGDILSRLWIEQSGDTIQFYDTNTSDNPSELLFNDTGTGSVININVRMLIDYETDAFTLRAKVERTDETQTHYSAPVAFYGDVTSNEQIMIMNKANSELTIDNIKIYSTPRYPAFYQKQQGDFNLACTYSAQGCYTARFYLNSEYSPMHLNFQDYEICIIGDLTNEQATREGAVNKFESWINKFDSNEQFLIGMLGFFLIVALGIYFTVHYEVRSGGILTGLVGVAWLLVASKFGLIPAFVTTVLIVLTSGLSAIKFIRALGGKED